MTCAPAAMPLCPSSSTTQQVKIYLNQDTCYIYIFVPHYLYTVKSPFGFRKHYLYTVKSPQRPPLSVDALVA